MEIENKHYRRYVIIYMIEGAALLLTVLALVLFVSVRSERSVVPFVADNLTAIKIVVYVLSGLLLGLILLLRSQAMKAVAAIKSSEEKAKFLAGRGTLINVFSYIPAVLGVALYLLGLTFREVRIFFFITIVLSYVAFYRFGRFAELVGIAHFSQLNKKL